MDEKKRLCKSRNNKKICGVCAGFADYLNLDPTIVRVLWALLAVFAGTAFLPTSSVRSSCPRTTLRFDRLTSGRKEIY